MFSELLFCNYGGFLTSCLEHERLRKPWQNWTYTYFGTWKSVKFFNIAIQGYTWIFAVHSKQKNGLVIDNFIGPFPEYPCPLDSCNTSFLPEMIIIAFLGTLELIEAISVKWEGSGKTPTSSLHSTAIFKIPVHFSRISISDNIIPTFTISLCKLQHLRNINVCFLQIFIN